MANEGYRVARYIWTVMISCAAFQGADFNEEDETGKKQLNNFLRGVSLSLSLFAILMKNESKQSLTK